MSFSRSRITGKERDSETGLDYFGARYYGSTMGRFASVDPKQGSARFEDPQTWNRYSYSRNNPLAFVDPDGRDFESAWNKLKVFTASVYTKVSIGVGVGGKAKVGSGKATAEGAYKGTIEFTTKSVSASHSVDLGVTAGPSTGPKVGVGVSVDQTLHTVNADGSVTGKEQAKVEVTPSVGGESGSISASDEKIGFELEEGVGAVGGLGVGATREGWQALGGAITDVKDVLIPATPPPPPPPPPPPECAKEKKGC